ncbi:TRAP transporter large permease subunit [Candidatus Sumerlaeota bacterium]|nr:TRAP transporter large permease subunit [Candidatus Sumerlaeota bacterium]
MKYLALTVFVVAYCLFFLKPRWRWQVGLIGVGILIISGCFTPGGAFYAINWNVMGIFVGTLVMAELFMLSRMPAVLAQKLVNISGTVAIAMLFICMLTSFISAFVENVATVLIMAPIALSITQRLKITPVPIIIALAISSNLQGTATLVGDPPSMLLAGYTGMNFMDFFFYQGRLSVFWFVELGALTSFVVLYFLFRKFRQPIKGFEVEKPTTLFPSFLLVGFIGSLVLASFPGSPLKKLSPGSISMIFAGFGVLWYCFLYEGGKWQKTLSLFIRLDWHTTVFLMCVFILVGGLIETGWIVTIASTLGSITAGNALMAFVLIIVISMLISAFVDNVPYLVTMLPVAQHLADSLGVATPLIVFALLIGSCLGGNITPLGAAANIVGMGILRRQKVDVSFFTFVKIGLPFTLVAVITSAIALWFVWAH